MNIKLNNSIVPMRLQPRGIRLHATRARSTLLAFKTPLVGVLGSIALVGHALAHAHGDNLLSSRPVWCIGLEAQVPNRNGGG